MLVTKMRKTLAIITAVSVMLSVLGGFVVQAENDVAGDLRWDFVEDTEGFEVESRCKIDGIFDGAMRVTSTRNDPIIRVKGLNIDPNEYRYFRFRLKNNTPSDYIEVFFWTASNEAHKAVTGVTMNSDEYIEYEIDLWSQTDASITTNFKDQEEYVTLRFDPMNKVTVHTVDVDYIVLSKYSKNDVLPDMIKNITIGEQTIDDMSAYGHNTYCEKNIYEDVFKTLSKDDISVTFNSGYENGYITTSIKETATRKIIDITAVCGDDIRTYRTVCKGAKRNVYLNVDSFELFNKKLTFSGSVVDEKGNPAVRPITILAHEKGGDMTSDISYVGVVMSDKDGKFSKSIKLYDPETKPLMFEMEVVFDASGAETPWCEYANYINNAYVDKTIDDIKNGDDDVMEYIMADESKVMFTDFGVWTKLYDDQDKDTKDDINEALEPYRNDLNSANVAKIVNGSILAVIIDDISANDAKDLIFEVSDKIYSIEVNGKAFDEGSEDEQKWIADNLKDNNASGCDSYEELIKEVRKSMLLYDVNHTTYMDLPQILLDNTDLLGDDLDVLADEDNEDIIDAAMKQVVLAASKSEFTKIKTLVDAVEDAFDDASDKITDKKPSGGSGGGGGRGGSLVTAGPATGQDTKEPAVDEKPVVSQKGYADMSGFGWAEEAVNELSDMGIVGGVGDNMFEPGRNITREEFVKIILGAFDLGTSDSSVVFDDVSKSDWFYPYVARATELGIVNGISENSFGAGLLVTREDMATIVYRVMNSIDKAPAKGNLTFADEAEIAEYAKDAVGALSGAGIINGVGDNMFAPANFATRAEAAVIIYRCMEV